LSNSTGNAPCCGGQGDKALYRARFAGFDKETADATCKQLKRNDFDCITVKN